MSGREPKGPDMKPTVEIEEMVTALDAVCFWHANGGTVVLRQKEDVWAGICKMDGWSTPQY